VAAARATQIEIQRRLDRRRKRDQADQNAPPPPVKIPIEVQRAMAQRVPKGHASGRRPDPAPGRTDLLPVPRRGKGIRTVELIYDGPAGKTTPGAATLAPRCPLLNKP